MAMGKGIGATGGFKGVMTRFRAGAAARKAAAAAGGPKATNPTAGKPSGMGVLGNSKAATNAAAATTYAAKAAGSGMMGNRAVAGRKVGDALTSATGKTSKAGRQPTSKKPFGTL